MSKKIIPILTIVLAIGLFAFIGIVQKQEEERAVLHEKLYEQRRPLQVKQEELEQQLQELSATYKKQITPCAATQVVFTELDEQVYSLCYPIMQEYGYAGILALSPTELPGEDGCMSVEQFRELTGAGWKTCITWQTGTEVNSWWPKLQEKLTALEIEQGQTLYFPQGTYASELDATIQELGFSTAVTNAVGEESPLQMQYEEGVWHVGAVGLMSPKPRLWLREAVAQYANIVFLVGFEVEDQLYNEKSFRSMLNCFDEYEVTEELVVSNIEEAKEQYYKQTMGVDPEVESEYQAQKTSLEEKIAKIKKQLQEIDAMY